MLPLCMRVDTFGTKTAVLSQNGIRHVYFFFILKYLWNPLQCIPSICSVGPRQPIKSVFEPEEDLDYFDKFIPL